MTTHATPQQWVNEIHSGLLAAGNPSTAIGAKRYLKSDLEHVGVTLPTIRQLVRAQVRAHGPLGHAELWKTARLLWEEPIHERRIATGVLLEIHHAILRPNDTRRLRELLLDCGTWALVDLIAVPTAGRLLLREPGVLP